MLLTDRGPSRALRVVDSKIYARCVANPGGGIIGAGSEPVATAAGHRRGAALRPVTVATLFAVVQRGHAPKASWAASGLDAVSAVSAVALSAEPRDQSGLRRSAIHLADGNH